MFHREYILCFLILFFTAILYVLILKLSVS